MMVPFSLILFFLSISFHNALHHFYCIIVANFILLSLAKPHYEVIDLTKKKRLVGRDSAMHRSSVRFNKGHRFHWSGFSLSECGVGFSLSFLYGYTGVILHKINYLIEPPGTTNQSHPYSNKSGVDFSLICFLFSHIRSLLGWHNLNVRSFGRYKYYSSALEMAAMVALCLGGTYRIIEHNISECHQHSSSLVPEMAQKRTQSSSFVCMLNYSFHGRTALLFRDGKWTKFDFSYANITASGASIS